MSSRVKRIQSYLNKFGLSVDVDGWLGNQTEQAVYALGEKVDENMKSDKVSEPKSAHFSLSEFRCKDGSQVPEKLWSNVFRLMYKLEELRNELCRVYGGKRVIYINSGFRTSSYNAKVGGASNSQHLYAKAADIRAYGLIPKQVYKIADRVFADGGVGIYDTFVHVDIRNGNARWDER